MSEAPSDEEVMRGVAARAYRLLIRLSEIEDAAAQAIERDLYPNGPPVRVLYSDLVVAIVAQANDGVARIVSEERRRRGTDTSLPLRLVPFMQHDPSVLTSREALEDADRVVYLDDPPATSTVLDVLVTARESAMAYAGMLDTEAKRGDDRERMFRFGWLLARANELLLRLHAYAMVAAGLDDGSARSLLDDWREVSRVLAGQLSTPEGSSD